MKISRRSVEHKTSPEHLANGPMATGRLSEGVAFRPFKARKESESVVGTSAVNECTPRLGRSPCEVAAGTSRSDRTPERRRQLTHTAGAWQSSAVSLQLSQ